MPIEANIPLQVQPLKLESPINQLGMMNEALKYGEMTRSIDEQNKLNEYLKSGADLSSAEGRRGLVNYGKTGLGYAKALNEQDLSAATLKKTTAEAGLKSFELDKNKIDKAINDIANFPTAQDAFNNIQKQVQSGQLPADKAQFLVSQLNSMPYEKFQMTQLKNLLGAKERLTLEETMRSNRTNEGIRQGQLDLSREGQRLQYNPEIQGRIEEAKVLGKARGEEATAPFKDIQANVKALKSAGYDPETGKDTISGLIQQSTGSFAGAGTDLALRGVGISTGGAKAIAALKTYESKLTQDLLGGKMGAGISNADRDFIVAGIGQIADSTLPVETRQAAWNAVKERMRVAGMVPAPKGQGETGGSENPYAKKTDAEIKKELGL